MNLLHLIAQTFPTSMPSHWTPEQITAMWDTILGKVGPWLLGIAAIITAWRSSVKSSNSDAMAKTSKGATEQALNRMSNRLNTHEEIITNVAHNSPPPGSLMDIEDVKKRLKRSREDDNEKGC